MRARTSLRVLISAGPTREPIDAARFISNYSTGYMGAQLAAQALARGHRVTVVAGPIAEPLPIGARVVPVETAQQMAQAMRRHAKHADVIVMAAAVADFRPLQRAQRKLPRAGRLLLRLAPTPEIIGMLPRRDGQLVAGFAVETDRVVPRAQRKLHMKRLDVLVAQAVEPSRRRGALARPFGRQPVRAWLLTRSGAVMPLGMRSKAQVARRLLDHLEALHV